MVKWQYQDQRDGERGEVVTGAARQLLFFCYQHSNTICSTILREDRYLARDLDGLNDGDGHMVIWSPKKFIPFHMAQMVSYGGLLLYKLLWL